MDLLTGKIRPIYFEYLSTAFGSVVIISVYSIVDTAMVGQYQGPDGTATLTIITPIWNVIYSLSLLIGIDGSVIFGTLRGQTERKGKVKNKYFTTAVIGAAVLLVITWLTILFFEKPILLFFGADINLLSLAQIYLESTKVVVPFFLFNQMLAALLRNDDNPGLATVGVLAGGLFNVFSDYIFVSIFNMGIYGARLTMTIDPGVSFFAMLSHFWSKKSTLAFQKPARILSRLKEISVTGFSTFFIDVATGILTVLFNQQIMKYLGTGALAIYGSIVNVSTFIQRCAYSVGQASQPIISINFGVRYGQRIKDVLRHALYTVAVFNVFWTALSLVCPNPYIYIFMRPTTEVSEMASAVIRCYGLSFILLPLNIFSTYYFQALMKPRTALIMSIARGFIISGILIMVLLAVTGADSIWLAMPVTELAVAVYAAHTIMKYTKNYLLKGGKGCEHAYYHQQEI